MGLFNRAITVTGVLSSALGLGCATVEPIHRPPTPAELDRVNDASGPVYVECLPPAQPSQRISRVVSADAAAIVIAPPEGAPFRLHLGDVTSFSAHRAGRGAAIGAGIGAGVAAVEILGLLAFAAVLGNSGLSDPGAPRGDGCDTKCAQFLIGMPLVSISVGAVIGALVGSRQLFPLNLAPASGP